jgi:hypothetical protein
MTDKDRQSKKIIHASDCAIHNAPAYEPGPCDCGAIKAGLPVHEQEGTIKHPKPVRL